jgi:hypothetical protein
MLQDIHQVDTIQRYPIGFKYPISSPLDLRAFRYGEAGGTLNPDFGAKYVLPQHVNFAAIAAIAAAGEKLVSITVAVTDGVNGDGNIAANELAGGYIVIYTHLASTMNRMIVANTATVGGGLMVVTIDKPLSAPLTVAMHAECMGNPYVKVQTGHGQNPVMGMPTMPATIGQFLWLQTWGPLWVNPQGHERAGYEVVFREDGSIDYHDPTDVTTKYDQHAGFVLPNLTGGGEGAPFIFLQITP